MLGEDDPTAPAPGTVQHVLEHCRTLRDNLHAIMAALAEVREDIDRSLRDVPPVAPPSTEADTDLDSKP